MYDWEHHHTQPYWCKRTYLEKRNKDKYKCSVPVKNNEYCPSFEYYMKKGNTCKNIIKSSMRTNEDFDLASELCILPKIKSVYINPNKNIFKGVYKMRSKTRKIKGKSKNITNNYLNIIY